MGDVMLSTPQKVLRDTLREKINSSSKDPPHSHPDPEGEDEDKDGNGDDDESTTDEDDYSNIAREVEIRREALRQRGRESYAMRKRTSIVNTNTTPVSTRSSRRIGNGSFVDRLNGIGGDNDDDDDDDEDVFFNESRNESRPSSEKKPPPRKKRKSGARDQAYHPSEDGSGTEEDEPYLKPEPGSGKRKASSSQRPGGSSPKLPVAGTPPPKAKRVDSTSTANTVVSRFKEGSMRDRVSAVPPQEIIGILPSSSSPARPDDDHGATMYTSTSATEANIPGPGSNTMEKPAATGSNGGSFTFGGLTSLISFNPFRIVKDIKDSWDRQKRLHEAKERRKKLLKERKIRGLLAYEEFKRVGALQGYAGNAAAVMGAQAGERGSPGPFGPIRVDYMQDYTMAEQYDHQIGRALSTDESRSASRDSTASAGLRNRRSTMTASPVRVRSMTDSFYEGREPYVDERDQGDSTQRYSVDSTFTGPSENLSRKSTPKPKTPRSSRMLPPTRVPPPSPIPSPSKTTNGGKFEDVKTLVKKKSKVFAATLTGRGEEAASKTRANSKEAPSKRETKRQERLQKKVSNLEDQLDKARRELEGATDVTQGSAPPATRTSPRKRILPINTTRGWESVMSARESVMMPGDETDEGEKTDIDQEHASPLSPVTNASFGGSFMAKTAEMTIMESLDEAEHAAVQGNRGSSSDLYDMVLPKRISKSNLGAARRRVSSGSGAPGSSAGVGLKHQGSLPVIPSGKQVEAVQPVPKFTNGK